MNRTPPLLLVLSAALLSACTEDVSVLKSEFGTVGSGGANGESDGGGFQASSGGADNGGGLGIGGKCNGVAHRAEPMPVDLYIMFDQSSSMSDLIPGSAQRWWDAAEQAVIAFVNDPDATGIGVGLQFFPYGGAIAPASCTSAYATPEVGIGALPGNASAIQAAIVAHDPSGFTPTGSALQGAIDHMKQWAPAHPGRAPAVVLVTDGFPTECEPRQVSDIAALAKAALETEPRVRTFVVGFSSGLTNLASIAQAGGTGDAFLIEGGNVSERFVQAMLSISSTTLQCDFEIPPPPDGMTVDIDRVVVSYVPNATGQREEIPRLDNLGGCAINANSGWYYDHPTQPTKILVCPGTCNRFAAGVVNIEFGCEPIRVPPR